MRRRGAKSFVDDLVLSRGVVLSRAELFCDLLRLSLTTRRFVRCRRTYLIARAERERAYHYCACLRTGAVVMRPFFPNSSKFFKVPIVRNARRRKKEQVRHIDREK